MTTPNQYGWTYKCCYQCPKDFNPPSSNPTIFVTAGTLGSLKIVCGSVKILSGLWQVAEDRFAKKTDEETPLGGIKDSHAPIKAVLLSGAMDIATGTMLTLYTFTNLFGNWNTIYGKHSDPYTYDNWDQCYSFCQSLNLPKGAFCNRDWNNPNQTNTPG